MNTLPIISQVRQLPTWTIFGREHLIMLILMTFCVFIFVYVMSLISNSLKRKAEILIGSLILLRKLICLPLTIYFGEWSWYEYLPLHLCDITVVVGALMLLTRSQKMFEITLFFGIPGALNAIFTPVLIHGDAWWYRVDYFVEHMSILVVGIYAILVWKLKPGYNAWWHTLIFVFVFFYLPVAVFNYFVDTNFMYTRFPPYENHPLVFGKWPYYAIGFNLIAVVICLAIHYLYNRRNNEISI